MRRDQVEDALFHATMGVLMVAAIIVYAAHAEWKRTPLTHQETPCKD